MSKNNNWKADYSKYKSHYQSLQKEVRDFLEKVLKKHSSAIHVAKVEARPKDKIKTIESIESNFENSNKYKEQKSLFDIKDIAGVRATCHCEDDVENLAILLEGELRQKYTNIDTKEIGGKGSEYPYRARHITFSKIIQTPDNKPLNIFCEIQLRTVMADAWAVQNHKYIYKKNVEGEAHDLTGAVSEIMNGCEKLWSLVKKKSLQKELKTTPPDILEIRDKAKNQLEFIRKASGQSFKQWFDSHKATAIKGLQSLGINTYMEVQVDPLNITLDLTKMTLRNVARNSTISTFGWPIGAVLENREEFAPRVDLNGIYAEILIEKSRLDESSSYDYWAIHSKGSFYLRKSLFEDTRKPGYIFFNTRIVRITEVLMYIKNLYSGFNVPINSEFEITIKHGGLKGRILSSSSPNRMLFREYKTDTNDVPTTIQTSLSEIDSNIIDLVEKFTKPLFEQFSFFELDRKVLEEIVVNYLNGKVV